MSSTREYGRLGRPNHAEGNRYHMVVDHLRAVLPSSLRTDVIHPLTARIPLAGTHQSRIGEVCLRADVESLRDRIALANTTRELELDTHFQEAVQRLSRSGPLLDIGASIGLYTSYALQHEMQVIAFEPDPESHRRLLTNTLRNQMYRGQLQIIDAAVGRERDTVELHTSGLESSCPSLQPTLGQKSTTTVDMFDLDTLISEGLIPRPSLIKIDVEGAEGDVIHGGAEYFVRDDAAEVLLETHPNFLGQFGTSEEEVLAQMESFGYRCLGSTLKRDEGQFHFTKL